MCAMHSTIATNLPDSSRAHRNLRPEVEFEPVGFKSSRSSGDQGASLRTARGGTRRPRLPAVLSEAPRPTGELAAFDHAVDKAVGQGLFAGEVPVAFHVGVHPLKLTAWCAWRRSRRSARGAPAPRERGS